MSITHISQLDLSKVYSYADYFSWKFQERVELIKGKIQAMSPAPSNTHQKVLGELYGIFYNIFKGHPCQMRFAPFDVRLLDSKKSTDDKDIYSVVQPDLCIICDLEKIDERGCIGSPDLVIEILSPGNSNKEMKLKYDLYEENRVKEYWVINPMERQLFPYVLENGIYIGKHPLIETDTVQSYTFDNLSFYLGEIFA